MNALHLTPAQARGLAIACQRLSGPRPPATPTGIMELLKDLGCVQIDPIQVVDRTQYLVLWSRLGAYARSDLHRLLYEERLLFEYWAHAASIVLTENYPIHQFQMQRFAQAPTAWHKRLRAWYEANASFREYILEEMRRHGPRGLKDLEDRSVATWESGGWSHSRNLSLMIGFVWEHGDIMVVERKGLNKKWHLASEWLPEWAGFEPLDAREVAWKAAQISLRALGVGTTRHIQNHFIRGFYPDLDQTLADLAAAGLVVPVEIEGWPGAWHMHSDVLPLLDTLNDYANAPQTVLLSPFDNLIADRDRTEQMWGFWFRIEIYVPAAQREYGYYVLPILHGDRLIGRIDPKLDRKAGVLEVNAVYAEADAPSDAATGAAVAEAITRLADFVGAGALRFGETLPAGWKRALLAAA